MLTKACLPVPTIQHYCRSTLIQKLCPPQHQAFERQILTGIINQVHGDQELDSLESDDSKIEISGAGLWSALFLCASFYRPPSTIASDRSALTRRKTASYTPRPIGQLEKSHTGVLFTDANGSRSEEIDLSFESIQELFTKLILNVHGGTI